MLQRPWNPPGQWRNTGGRDRRRCRLCAFGGEEEVQERLRGGVEFLAAAVQDSHGTVQVRGMEFDGDQTALGDLRLHGAGGEDADAGAQRHGLLDGLDIVEVHGEVHRGAVGAEEFVELAADGEIFVEADKILAVECGGPDFVFGGEGMVQRCRPQ